MSKRLCPSYNRNSKLAVWALLAKYTACHSMLRMRFGAVPDTDVKTPHPFAQVEQPLKPVSVRRSSQYGKMAYELIVVDGRHSLVKPLLVVTNCALPLDEILTAL